MLGISASEPSRRIMRQTPLARRENQVTGSALFLLYTAKGHLRRDALSLKIGSTAQDAVISSLSLLLE